MKKRQPGFTLIETLVAMLVLGVIIGIFGLSIYVTRAFSHAKDATAVDVFLRDVLDGLTHTYTVELYPVVGGEIIGLAYNVGLQTVVTGTSPPSGTQVLQLAAADIPLSSGISSLGLLEVIHTDVDLEADFRVDPASGVGWETGLVFGYIDSENYNRVVLDSSNLQLEKVSDAGVTVLDSVPMTVSPGTWFTLQVTRTGDQISVDKDDTPALSATDTDVQSGYAGLVSYGADTDVTVDDLVMTTPEALSLNFDAGLPGHTPEDFIKNAPYELLNFNPTLTLAEHLQKPDLLEVTVRAEWEVLGEIKSRELRTLTFLH